MSDYVRKRGEVIPQETRHTISIRYQTITKAINHAFWNSDSESAHSFYVGSYGRGTAIDGSDIDMLVHLPDDYYDKYNKKVNENGQSRLLSAVRTAILIPYPKSNVHADGQVVIIDFSDGMRFEVLPAFLRYDGSYFHPDTHYGGSWSITYPKEEQKALKELNERSNGLCFDTCKHMRRIRDEKFSSYKLSGIVIDSFVWSAIKDWHWIKEGETPTANWGDYELVLWQYYEQNIKGASSLKTPGGYGEVSLQKSRECLEKVLNYMVG